ncbi:GNAT family N-acetyltransferase [Stenotrophomonas maltophilia]|jgi:RimJ/RimL family protein N-acetyltransferase|uniref:GNAT family N-acetyltransferase n=2 Tax=Stenotrophomonas TaxID=40323 RepID=A0AA40Y0S0_STEMA|nr:GNAT family N-acetyltransferase [Stenotrophomonas maltophilia]MBH1640757.1 GNAT family N-acetyltransferase [Stenotrophomonas maltophilia]MBN4969276.1 GNAT family N-acetyltransferase [Stenotrophomonas maltophilia]MBN5093649.1 GNAT family N-acetyltransferase [Stenotrophomonas maltophilia]MCU1017958.1 GNAT family N-acetyltransferase [Stenotrophomonas maltophilia]
MQNMTSDDWTIDSPRLHLRPFTPGDADEAFAGITPGLTRYMAFEPPPSEAAFAAVWQTWLPTIADGTDITFVIRRREDDVFLGLAGLHRAGEAEPELGIWIAEVMHGHGYGREAVAAVWSAASERLRCAAFRYPVAERNRSSRSLAESLGGQAVAREQGVKYTAIVYRIPAAMHGVATDVAESR